MRKRKNEIDDWLDGGEEKPERGRIVTRTELSAVTGLTGPTIDKAISNGAPVDGRGSRREGLRINTAKFFDWYWRHKVSVETRSGDFEDAKIRDKESQIRLRELTIAEKEGELIPVADVIDYNRRKYAVVRSRFLAVESQVSGLSVEQREQLQAALADAFADVSGSNLKEWYDDYDSEEDDSESPSAD